MAQVNKEVIPETASIDEDRTRDRDGLRSRVQERLREGKQIRERVVVDNIKFQPKRDLKAEKSVVMS